jgi:hypothetical protein
MPDSVNVEGGKASKGEYGFRYGASVPRPMLMAFSKVSLQQLGVQYLKNQLCKSQLCGQHCLITCLRGYWLRMVLHEAPSRRAAIATASRRKG